MLNIIQSKLIYLLTFSAIYLAPINDVIIAVGVIIIIDLIFGLIASIKNNIKISSKKLSQTIIKMLIYQLLIITAFIIDTTLESIIPLVKITITFLSITEFFSIGENFEKITGKGFIKFIKENFHTKMKKFSGEDET